jgi:Rgp1
VRTARLPRSRRAKGCIDALDIQDLAKSFRALGAIMSSNADRASQEGRNGIDVNLASSLRVTVEPGQSSFFAGEFFHCKITFTNIAQPRIIDDNSGSTTPTDLLSRGGAAVGGTSLNSSINSSRRESEDAGSRITSSNASNENVSTPSASSISEKRRSLIGHQRQPSGSSRSFVAGTSTPSTTITLTGTEGKVSHAKSHSLADLRLQGSAPTTPNGSTTDLLHSGSSRRKRKGLIGRAAAKYQPPPPLESTPHLGSEAAPGETKTAGAGAARGHGKSMSVAHVQDRTGESIHGLGLGLPGGKDSGRGDGYPASRNVSAASAKSSNGGVDGDEERGIEGPRKVSSRHRPRVLDTGKQILGKVKGVTGRQPAHSRRKSVIQTQAEDLTEAFALEMGMTPEEDEAGQATEAGSTKAGSSSDAVSSAKSISDEISTEDGGDTSISSSTSVDESTASFGTNSKGTDTGFYGMGRNDTMESVVREDLSERLASGGQNRMNAGGRNRPSALDLARRESISSNRNLLSPTNVATTGTQFPAHLRRQASISSAVGLSKLTGQASPTGGAGSTTASPLFPLPAHDSIPAGTEVLLWSFAQFTGTFSIDESMVKPFDFELVKHRIAQGTLTGATDASAAPGGRSELELQSSGGRHGRTRTIGGGELLSLTQASRGQEQPQAELRLGTSGGSHVGDEAPETEEAMRRALSGRGSDEEGWRAYLKNRLTIGGGGGSESGFMGGVIRRQKHKRTGSTLLDTTQKTLLSKSIPTFSTPPSILCVDLSLEPGQSRSCECF